MSVAISCSQQALHHTHQDAHLSAATALTPFACLAHRLEVSVEALSIDPQLLIGYCVAAKLYHDMSDLTEAQPILEATLDLVGQGPSTSDRMAGSKADWHTGSAQVSPHGRTCVGLVLMVQDGCG